MMSIFEQGTPTAIFAAVAAGAAMKYAFGAITHYRRRTQYRYVGKVGELWVYPFKSFKGIQVNEAECTALGLSWKGMTDRHWTVATADGLWLTQRQEPSMALIEPLLNGDRIILRAPGMEPVSFPADPQPTKENLSKVTVKTDTVASVDVGDEVAQWLSTYFNRTGLRLHYSSPSLEKRDCTKAQKNWKHPAVTGDMCAFSDYCGYMILSNASLNDLNSKLAEPVPITNFRGNIIVDDCEPYAEDNWQCVRIGAAQMRALDACTRCILVTVNQSLGVKDKKEEPLSTLKTYRLRDPYGPKPCFGWNHTLDKPGSIKVGDAIYATMK